MEEKLDAGGLLLVCLVALFDALRWPDEHCGEDHSEALRGKLVLLSPCEQFSKEGDDVEEGIVVNVRQLCNELFGHHRRLDLEYVAVKGEGDDGHFKRLQEAQKCFRDRVRKHFRKFAARVERLSQLIHLIRISTLQKQVLHL